MKIDYEYISPTDKPALIAITTPPLIAKVESALSELGYIIHRTVTHDDFLARFARVQYQLVVIEDKFAAITINENHSLRAFQRLPMQQRRMSISFLIGEKFQTLNPLQAFQQSVHGVINIADADKLKVIIPQVVAYTEQILRLYLQTLEEHSAFHR